MRTTVIYCGGGMGEVVSGPGFRTCAHAGCAWPASATLSFDYDSRRTWLDDLEPRADPATYDLCSVHAGRFRPPRGWSSEDRRRMPEPSIEPREPAQDLKLEQLHIASGEPGSVAQKVALPET